jgi:hypothetical protein
MNQFVKAALLTLVIATPVAVAAPAVQAAPGNQAIATPKYNKTYRKHHHHSHKYHNGAGVKSNVKNK